MGTTIGLIKGDTRSLDYSSCRVWGFEYSSEMQTWIPQPNALIPEVSSKARKHRGPCRISRSPICSLEGQVMKLKTAGSDSQVRADCWTLIRSWDLSAVEHGSLWLLLGMRKHYHSWHF